MTGPVKTVRDTKAYLEQRSLITIDNNYNFEILAQLLVTASFDPKIPDQAMGKMRAKYLFIVSKFQNTLVNEIAMVVTENICNASNCPNKELEQKHKFITATLATQAKHVQYLHELSISTKETYFI